MHSRKFFAVAFFLTALALLALGLLPRPRLHSLLSAGSGHSVTSGYVEAVHGRTLAYATLALAIGVGAWSSKCLGPGQLAKPRSFHLRPEPIALLLIGIGIVTRALLLAGPIHYDEAFTLAEYALRSPIFFLSRYTHANNHVFHTMLAWLVPSDQLWALRLPAFLGGIAVIFATYWLAVRWHGVPTARIAVALVAVASPLVEYSTQARGYTILTLSFLLLFLLDDDRLRAVALAIGAWTIPTVLYAAAAWALWMAVTERAWRRIAFVAFAGGGLTFLLYLPILLFSGLRSITSSGTTLSVPYPVLFRELPLTLIDLAKSWSHSFTIPLAIVLALLALLAMIRGQAPALACTMVAIGVMLFVLRKVPFPRVWIFVLPVFLIAAASMIARVRVPTPVLIAVTLILGANAVRVTARPSYVEDPAMRDSERVAEVIRNLPADALVLVTTPLDSAYAFYIPERIVQDRFDSDPAQVRAALLAAPRRYVVLSDQAGDAKLRALALPFKRVPVARFEHSTLVELQ